MNPKQLSNEIDQNNEAIEITDFDPVDSKAREEAEHQKRELLRHEAILNGKRRFKEVRTQLGLDLQHYSNKSPEFL